ncbi:peptidyl-prolyl cis-trans isomerase [Paenisporosarcina cavernae]|uniref:peptidylprolyl isomerase n=1 Tax=Paenisporosarcina cavernae TaxID=2320858 RepID=A0A385YUZ4_9BACL|nr:peptidyl-prolyl cis-trans isomerase [Paenisporosarcina cavernae]AYC30679.1 foldase [Paenisporosarcina cavernae]
MRRSPNVPTPKPARRLKTKPVLVVLSVLLLGNLLWFIAWLIPNKASGGNEEVASVGGEAISREDWMVAMESRYGKETLLDLVNMKVMEKAATKYALKATDEEIDLELSLLRSAQDSTSQHAFGLDEKTQREKVRAQLLLEKVLTKDVVIEDDAIRTYFDENKSLYNIPSARKSKIIVVASKKEAEETWKELEDGSSFEALARERSIDTTSAALGGDIGYVTDEYEDPAVADAAFTLDKGEWSEPVAMSNGSYAIVVVEQVVEGKTFQFEEVKDHIKRELALEQLPQSVSPEIFWKEFDTKWFYGE